MNIRPPHFRLRKPGISAIFVALLMVTVPQAARADSLVIDTELGPARNGPKAGSSMLDVERVFGEPAERSAPVGEPPITFWRYPGFTVYFEYEKVLHAVAKK